MSRLKPTAVDPSDSQLLVTCCRECAAQSDMAVWKRPIEDPSWALSKELGPWISALRSTPVKPCPVHLFSNAAAVCGEFPSFPISPLGQPTAWRLEGSFCSPKSRHHPLLTQFSFPGDTEKPLCPTLQFWQPLPA